MKSERRHELRESDLVHAIETGKRYLGGHGKRVGMGVLAVIAVIVGTNVVLSSRASDATDRWRKLWVLAFDSPEVSKQSMGTMLALADSGDESLALRALLNRGSRALVEANKGDALDLEFNKIARDSFERILARFTGNPIAKGVGHLGLATCEENEFSTDANESHKAAASAHLKAVLDDQSLQAMPFYQIALSRQENLDEVFKKVVFAPPLPPEESAAKAGDDAVAVPTPLTLTPMPAPPGFVPATPPAQPPAAQEKDAGKETDAAKETSADKQAKPDADVPRPSEDDQ